MSSVIGKRHHDGSSSNDEPRSKRIGVLPRLDIGPTTSLVSVSCVISTRFSSSFLCYSLKVY